MKSYGLKNTLAPTLSLFTSLGTLVCCALPALFVSLGMGAALAGLVSHAPGLVTLSENKGWVFGVSGFLIAISFFLQGRSATLPCPADPEKARACARLRMFSRAALFVAAFFWATGFFFAFIAPRIF